MKRLLVALRSATAWRQPAAARRTHKGNPRPCNRAANCQAGRRGPIAAISGPATIDDALPRSTNPNPHPLYVALVADRAAPLPRRPLSHFFFVALTALRYADALCLASPRCRKRKERLINIVTADALFFSAPLFLSCWFLLRVSSRFFMFLEFHLSARAHSGKWCRAVT